MALSREAVEYAARRYFDDGATLDAIFAEVNDRFGPIGTPASVRSKLHRDYPDRIKAAREARCRERNELRAKVKADALAGMSNAALADKYRLRPDQISRIAPVTRLAPAACQARRKIQAWHLLGAEPDWINKHPIRPELEGELTAAGKLFTELNDNDCRFPIGKGNDGGYRFCGCPRERSGTALRCFYCAKHGEIATLPAAPGEPGNPQFAPTAWWVVRLPRMDGDSRYADTFLRQEPQEGELPFSQNRDIDLAEAA